MTHDSASSLLALHTGGPVLTLVNVWDAESTRLVESAGAAAHATASFSVAESRGFTDGENMPVDVAIAAVAEVCGATSLPVTADLEAGYGDARATVRRAVAAGAVGANIEDRMDPLEESVARMEGALQGAADEGVDLVLNARTDAFIVSDLDRADRVAQAIIRGHAYLAAGATCVFVPLAPQEVIPLLVSELGEGKVSILGHPDGPHPQEWQKRGIHRVSFGPLLWRTAPEERADLAARLLATP
ncbi:isocitrate lyase/phosphoenolpyruvate mutase family protein [Demequina sp.]|uniref:isocitrate lyase/PEP mutase family protein n=1 Tax=Demequina sp. TaxID=2050685 RepID=UPI0025C02E58|nr:isocitrate lyase/phosphoenolpyruvate mutase family protein [Demequina sp.]